MKNYLLILSCSKTKHHKYNIPAIDLYNGMYYKVLRKNFNLKENNNNNLNILILSAKYGLINSNHIIDYYDEVMTPKRAKELQNQVITKLKQELKNNNYDEIFITMGKTYELALGDRGKEILKNNNAIIGHGMIGERLSQLKNWLISINK
ncbi:DUF6884 domain-containing protein [Methanococcus aeolicus]|uniref:DUF6884 domain-containing protein n=1 Tax=Methanococcus aeolicus (strain ATCC BAA-1280 / DSM 17508 / OCM 812 / Nankai-3) TaxID=419665 RepID=A6UTK1_META3|nr:DUF6884 domain-containing protein [Methanococcus aeolicus]ABR55823.1 hypothetical protein Maeo_0231 [Methanococcus aeolicus Nankai-3]UXM84073.1 peroxide stress protein YaaA [Methanococcus aeolicus]